MPRYRFHCTNGAECVLDTVGADVRAPDRLATRAAQIAREVMRTVSDHTEWSHWRVTVHDFAGRRVLLQPFVGPGAGLPKATS